MYITIVLLNGKYMLKFVDISPSDDENQRCQKINRNFRNILTALTEIDSSSSTVVTQVNSDASFNNKKYVTREEFQTMIDDIIDSFEITLDKDYNIKDYTNKHIYDYLNAHQRLTIFDENRNERYSINWNYGHGTKDEDVYFIFLFPVIAETTVDIYVYKCQKDNYSKTKITLTNN